ncbi:ATP-dependent helicase [Rhodococcus sp. (in: high G+C Gram-positive bacteria)]|uniref:ATP-dependent helicase n=1 Tax=Rhodococcus sp. TaxID=1831 RepID=UPI00257F6A48|nr:ATP-dependent helicase [Rhodococcus sp. (in: high G+C Gram-positive bacteria)]MBQ7803975.1 ATP-dependent helicase [Rhodococcus sp. (in: high G+C Gram-positive bacteria)]
MNNDGLSPEQLKALDPGIQLIEAGPGSGKTRTVVARYRQSIVKGRSAALLSFTNAAVDVARARCRDEPSLLDAPNFIGTFDQFFHRYVLTPYIRRRFGVSPNYLSSWDDLPHHIALIRPPGGGSGIRLSCFAREDNIWAVDEPRLNRTEEQSWRKLTLRSQEQINEVATKRIGGLYDSYIFDTAESRSRALHALQEPDSIYLGRLKRRFSEAIVDEFQDCDGIEHQLLGLLRSAGISVVAVADPDQAIYEFRQSSPGIYKQYRDGLATSAIASLTTCYRSTPAICSLTSALRTVGLGQLLPDPNHSGGASHIHVVVGSGIKAGSAALKLIRQQGTTSPQTRVIAHRRSDARALIRAGKQPPQGVSHMESLLVPLADLRSGVDARGRLKAVKRIEAFILNQFHWPSDGTADTVDKQLKYLGLPPEHIRIIASKLVAASQLWSDKKACSAAVRAHLQELAKDRPVDLTPRLGHRLVVPDKVWTFWESRTTAALPDLHLDAIRWAHVHSVKGDEFDGVVYAIPAKATNTKHVLDDWEQGTNSELRRVFYVGASRAGKMLVLVVPKTRHQQLIALLTATGVPHTINHVT